VHRERQKSINAIMRTVTAIFLILGLALHVRCEENNRDEDNGVGMLECMFEDNAGYCLRTNLARDLDRIELEVTGKKSEPPVSMVVEQAGSIIAEIVDDLRETGGKGIIEENNGQDEDKGKNQKLLTSIYLSHIHFVAIGCLLMNINFLNSLSISIDSVLS